MLNSIINTAAASAVTWQSLIICTLTSILAGLCVSAVYMYKNVYNKNFVITLTLLPVMVQAVIMVVNGNLGTGVAVMGAFSLVRFRSLPGGAREIGSIFFAMAAGLAVGTGYVVFASVFVLAVGAFSIALVGLGFGQGTGADKDIRITIPENLEYSGVFDDIFSEYTSCAELISVKSAGMGSVFELRYRVSLKNEAREKEFLDSIRCRNGNLSIVCARQMANEGL